MGRQKNRKNTYDIFLRVLKRRRRLRPFRAIWLGTAKVSRRLHRVGRLGLGTPHLGSSKSSKGLANGSCERTSQPRIGYPRAYLGVKERCESPLVAGPPPHLQGIGCCVGDMWELCSGLCSTDTFVFTPLFTPMNILC